MTEKKSSYDSYEKAFQRLEEILQKMNEPKLPLDESLTLFEEATYLMSFCEKKLDESEKKIEMLTKSKSGELQLDPETGKPLIKSYHEK